MIPSWLDVPNTSGKYVRIYGGSEIARGKPDVAVLKEEGLGCSFQRRHLQLQPVLMHSIEGCYPAAPGNGAGNGITGPAATGGAKAVLRALLELHSIE